MIGGGVVLFGFPVVFGGSVSRRQMSIVYLTHRDDGDVCDLRAIDRECEMGHVARAHSTYQLAPVADYNCVSRNNV